MIKLGNKFYIGFPPQEKLFPTIHLYWKSYQDKMMVKLKELGQVVNKDNNNFVWLKMGKWVTECSVNILAPWTPGVSRKQNLQPKEM